MTMRATPNVNDGNARGDAVYSFYLGTVSVVALYLLGSVL